MKIVVGVLAVFTVANVIADIGAPLYIFIGIWVALSIL